MNTEKIVIKEIGFVVGKNIKPFTFDSGNDMGYGRKVNQNHIIRMG